MAKPDEHTASYLSRFMREYFEEQRVKSVERFLRLRATSPKDFIKEREEWVQRYDRSRNKDDLSRDTINEMDEAEARFNEMDEAERGALQREPMTTHRQ